MGKPDMCRGPWRGRGLKFRARAMLLSGGAIATKSQRESGNPTGGFSGKEHPRFGFLTFFVLTTPWEV